MIQTLKTLAAAAALATVASGAAMAQMCPAGYVLTGTVCQPAATPGGIVGGAINGAGQIVGGALNAAGTVAGAAVGTAGAVAGTAVGAVAPPPAYGSSVPPAPACAPGYTYYSGGCYPAR